MEPHDCPDVVKSGFDPGPLLVALPYLMGFYPQDSLVAVMIGEDQRVVLTLRVDWSAAVSYPAATVAAIQQRVVTVDPAAMVLVASNCTGDPSNDLNTLSSEFTAAEGSPPLLWAGQATTNGWTGLGCQAAGCAHHPMPTVAASEPALQLIVAGAAPLSCREDVIAEVCAQGGDERIAVPAWHGEREAWRDDCILRLQRLLASDQPPTDADLVTLMAGCADIRVRDTWLRQLTVSSRSQQWSRVWRCTAQALRRAPDSHIAAVGAVAGLAAWQLGDGLRAAAAVDRALASDADHSLSRLLRRALDAGMPPGVWQEVMANLSEEQCRHGTRPESAA
jgi:AcrR family transcriptional regulator